MRILLFNWRDPKNPKAGGAEVATLHHALGWIQAGHSVLWFSTTFPDAKSYENYRGIHIYRQGNRATVYLKAFIFYLRMRKKIDVVVDEIHGLPFFTPLYVTKPKIAFINEIAEVIWDYVLPFPFNIIGKNTEPLILQLYKKTPIMTGSNSAKNDLVKLGFSKERIYVIHHGLDTKQVSLSIKKEPVPTLLFVNRLVKMKGIEDVLYAFALIKPQLKDAKLWIVGRGEEAYINKLHDMVKVLDIEKNTKFFGYVNESEKFSLYKRAHLLLHASVKEGWGLNVIEAASQETPTIAYRVGGLVDSVKHKKTGILVEENNPGNLAKEAIHLIKNNVQYAKMQKSALYWSKTFSWDKSVKESLTLFKSVKN